MIKEGFKDELHTNVKIRFSWRDRLRILFGKTAHCDVRTQTENLPGRCESTTKAWVEPIYQRPVPSASFQPKPKSDKRIIAKDGFLTIGGERKFKIEEANDRF